MLNIILDMPNRYSI